MLVQKVQTILLVCTHGLTNYLYHKVEYVVCLACNLCTYFYANNTKLIKVVRYRFI